MAYITTAKVAGRQRNRPIKDYSGLRYGRLTALRLVKRDDLRNDHRWLFQCDCGNEPVLSVKSVRSGHTKSCGCIHSAMVAKRNTTHGLSRTQRQEYRSWKDMRSRCLNERNEFYRDYGGRGISICPRWDDFGLFFADMGDRPEGMTLDRIDVNGNYEPGNCRWATSEVQANNKRTNQVIEYLGERLTLQQWCRRFGLEHSKARYRLAQGWTLDRVFSQDDFRRPRS